MRVTLLYTTRRNNNPVMELFEYFNLRVHIKSVLGSIPGSRIEDFRSLPEYSAFTIIPFYSCSLNDLAFKEVDIIQERNPQQKLCLVLPPHGNLWKDKEFINKIKSITPKTVVLVEEFIEYKKHSTSNVKFVPFYYRFHKAYIDLIQHYAPSTQSFKPVINEDYPSHRYLCLNGNISPHRIALYAWLRVHNGRRSKISFLNRYGIGQDDIRNMAISAYNIFFRNSDIEVWEYIQQNVLEFTEKSLDIAPSNFRNSNKFHHYNKKLFDSTHFSIITEPNFLNENDDSCFLSEKVFEAIAHLHPFLIVGNKGALSIVKSLGFSTFPELFDESYDKDSDLHRFFKICDQSKRKVNKFDVTDKLVDNFYRLMDWNLHKSMVDDLFREIYYF